MGRDALQPFELQVLVAALRLVRMRHSVPIVLELEKHSDRRVSQAAVFIAVQRLEARGLVATRLDERGTDTGRTRRYVKVTPLARRPCDKRASSRRASGAGSTISWIEVEDASLVAMAAARGRPPGV